MGMLTMAENTKKKTNAKSLLKSVLKIFKKDDKKEKELETGRKEAKTKVTAPVISPAARFREKFHELERKENREKSEKEIGNDEIEEFDEGRKNERLESQSTQDSGFEEKEEESVENDVSDIFSNLKIDVKENKNLITQKEKKENVNEAHDDVTETLKNLNLGQVKEKKEKKVMTVTLARTPIVNKNLTSRSQAHPYAKQSSQVTVNKQTFSGGQVIEVDEVPEIVHTALKDLFSSSKRHGNELNKEEDFNIITDFIKDDQNQNIIESQYQYSGNVTYPHVGHDHYQNINVYSEVEQNNILDEFGISQPVPDVIQTSSHNFGGISRTDGMEQLLISQSTPAITCPDEFISLFEEQSVYMTPPRSVNMASPMSDFQSSPRAYTSNSDYTFSPSDRSSPLFGSDLETYQKIPQFEDQSPIRPEIEKKKMNLKQFKNMQKEISESFCKKECCQKNRKSCTDIFNERFGKFHAEERKNICLNISKLDLKAAFGVLVRILLSIAKGSDKEDLEYAIFRHVCGRVLAEHPTWFLGNFGATLIELAALRCNAHSVLTRYLVECIRAVKRPEGLEAKDCLLPLRVDSKRDNLVIACALGGDSFADVLHWLVTHEPHQPPLFDLGHVNTEGYSALHVACKSHRATSPRVHIVHVLLQHGRVDLWQGDLKGGDTALHLAVNSPTCDLQLVLLLFHQAEQKQWKQLATCNNLGSVTPIEYARCAVKSKQNFPGQVLEFMKKLR